MKFLKKHNYSRTVVFSLFGIVLMFSVPSSYADLALIDGIMYETTSGSCRVVGIRPEAGKNIRIPEWIPNPIDPTYHDVVKGFGDQVSCSFDVSITNKDIETLWLPRYFRYYDLVYPSDALTSLINLKTIEVDPLNEELVSYNGLLYESYNGNRYGKLNFFPRQSDADGRIALHPDTEIIGIYAIGGTKNLKYLVLPPAVNSIDRYGLSMAKGLETLEFNSMPKSFEEEIWLMNGGNSTYPNYYYQYPHFGGYESDDLALSDMPNLRHVIFTDKVSEIEAYFNDNPRFVKLSLPSGLEKFALKMIPSPLDCIMPPRLPEDYYGLMYVDLSGVKSIEDFELRRVQAIKLGEHMRSNSDSSPSALPTKWIECSETHHVDICLLSLDPLTPPMPSKLDTESVIPNWTVYVPAEAIETYKTNWYWSTHGEILPITDKLIPLVSEPELEIEQYLTHEYLWDVMPLGEAVAAERGEWTSEDTSVATIDENSVLTAVGRGETTITFTLADTKGNLYTAESKVTVVENVSGVEEIEDEPVAVAPEISVPDGVYDLHGRRVGDTTDSLAPGLYIVRHQGKTEKRLVR